MIPRSSPHKATDSRMKNRKEKMKECRTKKEQPFSTSQPKCS